MSRLLALYDLSYDRLELDVNLFQREVSHPFALSGLAYDRQGHVVDIFQWVFSLYTNIHMSGRGSASITSGVRHADVMLYVTMHTTGKCTSSISSSRG